MPIDYSKWDHLDDYSSDDEEDDKGDTGSSTPRVTQLDAPSRVTFGGGAAEVGPVPTAAATSTNEAKLSQLALTEHKANTSTAANLKGNDSASWTLKGGMVSTASDSRELYWSQDRYSVTMRLELDIAEVDEKVQGIEIEGILPYSDRHCAMGSSKPRLKITTQGKDGAVLLLEGDLPHPVHLAQDESKDELDWTVERQIVNPNPNNVEKRFVSLTLYKAVPMQGIHVWWRRPLMEFQEIEVETQSNTSSSSGTASSQEFLQAWEEAHRLFREKKKSPPAPTLI